jgi:RAQPRD family integrative conjugative element protein
MSIERAMKTPKFLLLASCIASSLSANADFWAERESLANIRAELASIESLVSAAKSQSNSNDRTTFDYQVLLDDLRKIQAGISHHLAVPMEPVVPSKIDALSSNYTEHQ